MGVLEILKQHRGISGTDELYRDLWKCLSSELNATKELLESDFIPTYLETLPQILKDGIPEKRLVWFGILRHRLDFLGKDSIEETHHLTSKILETLEACQEDSAAIGACLHLLNACLVSSDVNLDAEKLVTRAQLLVPVTKFREHAVLLQDYLYFILTHPCCEQNQANELFMSAYESGIFLWLNQTGVNVFKTRFIESLFENAVAPVYYKRVHAYQLLSQEKMIQPAINFCSEEEFSRNFDPTLIGDLKSDVYEALSLRLEVHVEDEKDQVLNYFFQKFPNINNFLHSLSLRQSTNERFCITPSRNVYIHVLKVYLSEFCSLQYAYNDFIASVRSRIRRKDEGWEGDSKYAQVNFKIDDGNTFEEAQIICDVSKGKKKGSKSSEWVDPTGRHIILVNERSDEKLVRVVRTDTGDKSVTKLHVKKKENEKLSDYDLMIILSSELDIRIKSLDYLLHGCAINKNIWEYTKLGELVSDEPNPGEVLLANVFKNTDQIGILKMDGSQLEDSKRKKRKLGNIHNAIFVNDKEGSWKIDPAVTSNPKIDFTSEQVKIIFKCLTSHCYCVNGLFGSGKATIIGTLLDNLFLNDLYASKSPNRTLVVCDTEDACLKIIEQIKIISPEYIVNLNNKTPALIALRKMQLKSVLTNVQKIADALHIPGNHSSDIGAALSFRKHFLIPAIEELKSKADLKDDFVDFQALGIDLADNHCKDRNLLLSKVCTSIAETFEKLQQLQIFFVNEKRESLIEACDLLVISKREMVKHIIDGFRFQSFHNLVLCNVEYFQAYELLFPLIQSLKWQKIVLTGDFVSSQCPYIIHQIVPEQDPELALLRNFDANPAILSLRLQDQNAPATALSGFASPVQLIKSPGSFSHMTNLEEAEYCVLLFAYLRLLGYPSESISILTVSPYQSHAIASELEYWLGEGAKSSSGNLNFGLPKSIKTIDEKCSDRNDIVIVSTSGSQPNMGYLSRYAKQGLFVFNESGTTLKVALDELRTSEITLKDRTYAEIMGLDHMESFVKKITRAKIHMESDDVNSSLR